MLPQQWSNPDYCYLEPASRVKPEQPHQMAVSTNHNLGGHVIQLTSHLIDVKNYRGFQGYSPFHEATTKSETSLATEQKAKDEDKTILSMSIQDFDWEKVEREFVNLASHYK